MIRVKNNRKGGNLFHYAHFVCDCLFPEIINDIHLYDVVIREKTLDQTLGNFEKIYTNIMNIAHEELCPDEFNNSKVKLIVYKNKEHYLEKKYFDKFRTFIFQKCIKYDSKKYPEVILIKRGKRINLIDDPYLAKINTNITNGKERREIHNVLDVEYFLKKKYDSKFESLFFENLSFQEQVMLFHNAKLIICAHGAVMSNMFFCKENTKIIEITCDTFYPFFDQMSKILSLKHIKCTKNNFDDVTECIEKNGQL
jgi:hypothetical protein